MDLLSRRMQQGIARRTWTWAICASAVISGGCNSSPTKSDLAGFLREQSGQHGLKTTTESVDIVGMERTGNPPRTKLEFKAQDQFRSDVFAPVALDEAWAVYEHSGSDFEAAVKSLEDLHDPEFSTAADLLPKKMMRPSGIYRKLRSQGDSFDWSGVVYAEKTGSGWKFADLQKQFPDELDHVAVVTSSELSKEAVVIGPGTGENVVSRLVADQKTFISAVNKQRKAMEERLVRERKQLLSAAAIGQSWTASIPSEDGTPIIVLTTFVERSEDGSSLVALVNQADDASLRSVWTGGLMLAPPTRNSGRGTASRDGWTLVLSPAVKGQISPLSRLQPLLRFGPDKADGLIWESLPTPAAMTHDADSRKLPAVTELTRRVREEVSPGQVWEGTYVQGNQAAQRVRLTFTEHRDAGKYLRAVLELTENPHAPLVGEGAVKTAGAELYGFPIRLKIEQPRREPAIKLRSLELNLGFALDDSGALQGNGLSLKRVKPIDGFIAGRSRWTTQLTPGSRWSGKITKLDSVSEAFTLTVAETRDDLAYVRVLAESPTNSSQFRVFEGVVSTEDADLDDFGLTIRGKSSTRNHPGGIIVPWWRAFFGTHLNEESVHHFRLLPDGKTLVGISAIGEKILLTRDDAVAPLPLDRVSFVKAWKEKCAKGSRWRGMLHNWVVEQKTEVELEFLTEPNDLDEVAVSVMILKQPRSKQGFIGRFRPDDDVEVNGYALKLKKQTIGMGNSLVFGKVKEVELEFRLGQDRETLHGVGRYLGGTHEAWAEILDLQRADDYDSSKTKDK